MFIRSERLFLRPGWPEDWQELLTRIDDEQVVRNLARAPWPYTADDARWFSAQPQDSRHPHFLITLPTAQGPAAIVGSVGLAPGEGVAELGYWIGRDYWGRGFATEAASAVLRLAKVLGHRSLNARHFIDNPASGKVLQKLGFRPTGKTVLVRSPARDSEAPSATLTLRLGDSHDCDGGGDDANAAMPVKRAA